MTSIAQPATDTGLLRLMVRGDGIFTIGVGALGLILNQSVADMMGIAEASYVILASLILLVYGASMYYFGSLPVIPRWYAWFSIEADFSWALGSFIIIFTGIVAMNDFGKISMFVCACAVLLVIALKYTGLRQLSR